MQYCVYAHALSCTEHMSRKRIWSLKWQTKTKKKKLTIYRSWPWISNCWEWDSNSGLSGIEPRALTTRPRRLGANLRRDATSRLLFLNQSVLADFDDRKKNKLPDLRLVAFQARVIMNLEVNQRKTGRRALSGKMVHRSPIAPFLLTEDESEEGSPTKAKDSAEKELIKKPKREEIHINKPPERAKSH